jgi:hypothetical protein
VTVGTLGRGVNKRVDVSIRATAIAAAAGAHVGLVVVGDGEQRGELEQLAATLGISDRVHFLGMRSDVPAIMASCDVFVHAAPFEPFGIVCIEAMACGLPVIVPDKGGISEAVREGETGFIYATLDADALARAMIRLANDPAALAAVGAAALADVRALGRWSSDVVRVYLRQQATDQQAANAQHAMAAAATAVVVNPRLTQFTPGQPQLASPGGMSPVPTSPAEPRRSGNQGSARPHAPRPARLRALPQRFQTDPP